MNRFVVKYEHMKTKIIKSLRFKLTLWYSLLVLVFCSMFILSMNLLISQYTQNVRENINQDIEINNMYPMDSIMNFTDRLNQEEKELFLETRNEDLENIRNIS